MGLVCSWIYSRLEGGGRCERGEAGWEEGNRGRERERRRERKEEQDGRGIGAEEPRREEADEAAALTGSLDLARPR